MQSLWDRTRVFLEDLSQRECERLKMSCRVMGMKHQGVDYPEKDSCIWTISSKHAEMLCKAVSKEVTDGVLRSKNHKCYMNEEERKQGRCSHLMLTAQHLVTAC